ncbi:hypothetical protein L218DRAFT_948193 [Marasmius fiardii PR-910]|nr:hypothetical protein L218DRAFT_948193 [Marasmius fiardii PR-910]
MLEHIFNYAVEKNCLGWQKSQRRSDAYSVGWRFLDRGMPTLKSLKIELDERNLATAHFILLVPTPNRRISPQVHERLRALTLESSSLHQSSYFLSLTCPSLTSLSLSVVTNHNSQRNDSSHIFSSEYTNIFIQFLHRSNSLKVLHTLRLVNTPLDPFHFIRILRRTPRIHVLEITSKVARDDDSPSIIFCVMNCWPEGMNCWPKGTECLTRHPLGAAPLVPILREVRFTVNNDWRSNAFESMLQTRVDRKLESAYLKIRGKSKHLDVDHLQRINAKTNLAVRVVEGDDEREVVGYCEPHPKNTVPNSGKTLSMTAPTNSISPIAYRGCGGYQFYQVVSAIHQ